MTKKDICKSCGNAVKIRKGDGVVILKHNKLHMFEITGKTKDGGYLMKLTTEEKESKSVRQALAKQIVEGLGDSLKEQAVEAVEKSLSYQDASELRKIKKDVDGGKPPVLESTGKPGCL